MGGILVAGGCGSGREGRCEVGWELVTSGGEGVIREVGGAWGVARPYRRTVHAVDWAAQFTSIRFVLRAGARGRTVAAATVFGCCEGFVLPLANRQGLP